MLGGWNAYLVGRGETAIEFYTNRRDASELKRIGKVSKLIKTCLFHIISDIYKSV